MLTPTPPKPKEKQTTKVSETKVKENVKYKSGSIVPSHNNSPTSKAQESKGLDANELNSRLSHLQELNSPEAQATNNAINEEK